MTFRDVPEELDLGNILKTVILTRVSILESIRMTFPKTSITVLLQGIHLKPLLFTRVSSHLDDAPEELDTRNFLKNVISTIIAIHVCGGPEDIYTGNLLKI